MKLTGAFLALAVITAAMGWFGLHGLSSMQRLAEDNAYTRDIANTFLKKEVDHLNWIRKVAQFQGDENLTKLGVQTDAHKCAFGQWYYGESRKAAEEAMPELRPLLEQVEPTHRRLHESAIELERILAEGSAAHQRAMDFFKNETSGVLADMQGLLGDLRTKVDQHAQREQKEADAKAGWIKVTMGLAVAANVIIAIVLGLVVSRYISRPLRSGADFARRLSSGDLTQRLEIQRSDELGQLADAMNEMSVSLRQNFAEIRESVLTLASASQELSATSTQVSSNSDETSSQANVVAAAAEQVSHSVLTVATAAEEMTASIKEIAQQASEAAQVAGQAAEVAGRASGTIVKLSDSSNEIGAVVKAITSIAEQTNLLALNATIEAARAGEAGKGFAVVASEVKELAKQTEQATEEIRSKIEAMQSDTKGAIDAIQQITEVIKRINDIQMVVASSVEEQAATMNEISGNSSEASRGSAEIAQNITSVSQSAGSSTDAATHTASAANELAQLAARLDQNLSRFNLGGSSGESNQGILMSGSAAAADVKQIDKAIAAHGMWKQRLLKAINTGHSEYTPENIDPDDRCEFGKWLYSLSEKEKASVDWNQVRSNHAEFHHQAAAVLRLALDGKPEAARQKVEQGGSYDNTSSKLTSAMMTWKANASGGSVASVGTSQDHWHPAGSLANRPAPGRSPRAAKPVGK